MRVLIAALLALLLAGAPRSALALGTELRIPSGMLAGAYADEDRKVVVFRNIPYAAPPVGPLRWRPPAKAAPWEGVRDATAEPLRCPQPPGVANRYGLYAAGGPQPPMGEDCLTLNVFAPAEDGPPRAVMVWIHGGGLQRGFGGGYDGTPLARKGVVVVTINYRLGPLGFLAHPALSAESPEGISGNYGILDQIAALAFVRDTIAAFGGDPGRVTIFGESAGSWSVNYLMASPRAAGLFQRAIGQSGGMFGYVMPALKAKLAARPPLEETGTRLAAALGIDGAPDPAAALRALTPEAILAGNGNPATPGALRFTFVGNVDGAVLPGQVHDLFAEGRFNRVPVIVGSNADEGSFYALRFEGMSAEEYRRRTRETLGPLADAYFAAYPLPEGSSPLATYAASYRDENHSWHMRQWARSVTDAGLPAYRYLFTRHPPGELAELGAYHAIEIPYVFGTLRPSQRAAYEAVDFALSEAMSDYWVAFAKTGDPNGPGRPVWTPYDPKADDLLELGARIVPRAGALAAELAFMDELYRTRMAAARGE